MHLVKSRTQQITVCAVLSMIAPAPFMMGTARGESATGETISARPVIYVVGQNGLAADPFGEFTVCYRGPAGCIAGAPVTVDFTRCPDIRIAQFQPFVSFISCGVVRATTGSDGLARFRIVGHAVNTGCSPGGGDVYIYAGALTLIRQAACFDQDGGGVGASDMSLWLSDFGCGQYFPRSDYNGDGTIGSGDLSVWLTVFGAGGSVNGPLGGFACKPGESVGVTPSAWGRVKTFYR